MNKKIGINLEFKLKMGYGQNLIKKLEPNGKKVGNMLYDIILYHPEKLEALHRMILTAMSISSYVISPVFVKGF